MMKEFPSTSHSVVDILALVDTAAKHQLSELIALSESLSGTTKGFVAIKSSDTVTMCAAHGMPATELPTSDALVAGILQSNEGLSTEEATKLLTQSALSGAFEQIMGWPLILNDQGTIGIICFGSTTPLTLSDGQRKALKNLALQITWALEHRVRHAALEGQFQLLMDQSSDLVSLQEVSGALKLVSSSVVDHLGYEKDELVGTKLMDLVHSEEQESLRAFLNDLRSQQNGPNSTDIRLLHKDGSYRSFSSFFQPIYNGDGSVASIQGTHQDKSQWTNNADLLEKADKRLDHYRESLKRLNEIFANSELTSDLQISEALWVTTEFLGLEFGALTEVEGETYSIMNMYGNSEVLTQGNKFNLSSTFCETAYRREEILALENISGTTFKVHAGYELLKFEAYIGIPYFVSGSKKGTVFFASTQPRPEAFEPNELEFIKLVSRWMGFILQHEEYEKKLMSDKMILQAFVSSAPAAIAMLDENLNYIAASDKWYSDYELENEYIIGRNYFDVLPDIGDEWRQIFESALGGKIEFNEQDLVERANGEIQWIRWEVRPWHKKLDTIGGLIIYTDDITQQKEQQLQLKIAKRKAEQASKAREQFLSTMSHEIRTPLNAILGMTDLMLMEDQDAEQRKRLELLKFSGNNLLVLINDILDYNKIEAGKLEFELANFNLKRTIERLKDTLAGFADKKNLELKTIYDPNLPEYIKGDSVRIGQVLTNLVNNAIKFTEEGYVSLRAKLLNLDNNYVTLKIEVKDTGIGIPPEKIDTIFGSFEQASADTTRKYGGTGLGLAITKKILALMNSDIKVQSSEGLGSVFFFEITLPVGEIPEDEEVATVSTEIRKDIRALVAEDNDGNRVLIESLFRKWNIDLTFAFNGREATEKVQTKEFDIVFMDLQMPEMDGFEATTRIRAMEDEYFKKVPIIALTASVLSNVLEKTKEVGMVGYVSKPFNPKDLQDTIAKFTSGENVVETEVVSQAESVAKEFPYLRELIGDDDDALREIVNTSVTSVKNAVSGVAEGLNGQDITKVRQELHVLRPNLHNLEMSFLIKDLPAISELNGSSTEQLQQLLDEINKELTSTRFKNFVQ